ncbi:MAG: hypothetical protein KBT34_10400 [Prevotella sp.]|nr:hypothetical protein [Candidatus Prevotella equi]
MAVKHTGGLKPAYNYDAPEFYDAIKVLAKNGASDDEIAVGLKAVLTEKDSQGHIIKYGPNIDPTNFNSMKNGKYECWTDEENERRGSAIRQVLMGARLDTNRIVKATYLATALGNKTVTSKTVVKKRLRIDGELTDNEEIQTTEVTSGLAPNMQALSLWLKHHDPEWRKREMGIEEEENPYNAPTPAKVKKGVDITSWLDKELLDAKEEDTDADSVVESTE